MRLALVHDWLNQMGGAEDVLETLVEMKAEEVERLLHRYHANTDSITKLNAALANLKLWTRKHSIHVI